MNECLFCKIVSGDIPSAKIWENDTTYAFLDLFPNCKGQSLVIPKAHFDSEIFEMDINAYTELFVSAKEVAAQLKQKLGVQRVGMIVEGMGVNHAHIKLYPMHGLSEEWSPNVKEETIYFSEYPGYMTTKMGEQLSREECEKLQKIITQ